MPASTIQAHSQIYAAQLKGRPGLSLVERELNSEDRALPFLALRVD